MAGGIQVQAYLSRVRWQGDKVYLAQGSAHGHGVRRVLRQRGVAQRQDLAPGRDRGCGAIHDKRNVQVDHAGVSPINDIRDHCGNFAWNFKELLVGSHVSRHLPLNAFG